MTRQPVDSGIRLPEIQPQASPIDSYYRPKTPDIMAPNPKQNLARLAQSLGTFSQTLGQYADQKFKIKQEQDQSEGAKAALQNQMLFNDAIEKGVVSPGVSPWYRLGYEQTSLKLEAGKYHSQLLEDYTKEGVAGRDDIDGWLQEKRKAALAATSSYRGQDVANILMPDMISAESSIKNSHVADRAKVLEAQRLDAEGRYVTETLNTTYRTATQDTQDAIKHTPGLNINDPAVQKQLAENRESRYKAIGQKITQQGLDYAATSGGDGLKWRTEVIKAVKGFAQVTGDSNVVDIFNYIVDSHGNLLSHNPDVILATGEILNAADQKDAANFQKNERNIKTVSREAKGKLWELYQADPDGFDITKYRTEPIPGLGLSLNELDPDLAEQQQSFYQTVQTRKTQVQAEDTPETRATETTLSAMISTSPDKVSDKMLQDLVISNRITVSAYDRLTKQKDDATKAKKDGYLNDSKYTGLIKESMDGFLTTGDPNRDRRIKGSIQRAEFLAEGELSSYLADLYKSNPNLSRDEVDTKLRAKILEVQTKYQTRLDKVKNQITPVGLSPEAEKTLTAQEGQQQQKAQQEQQSIFDYSNKLFEFFTGAPGKGQQSGPGKGQQSGPGSGNRGDLYARPRAGTGETFNPQQAPGMVQPGNIDIYNRPVAHNANGSISTVRSISIEVDGKEVLIPTVSPEGKVLSDEDAKKLYKKTGQHLGVFEDIQSANDYAERLHQQQDQQYTQPQEDKPNEHRDDPISKFFGAGLSVAKSLAPMTPAGALYQGVKHEINKPPSISQVPEEAIGRALGFGHRKVDPNEQKYAPLAFKAAQKYGIDPYWFVAQIKAESTFNPAAHSQAGAQGIAQIVPKHHPKANTQDPEASLDYAARTMANYVKKYGSYEYALVAYNGGGDGVNFFKTRGGIFHNPKAKPGSWANESGGYVKKIQKYRDEYLKYQQLAEVPNE